MGMATTTYYTADMVRALPEDGNRYETVHGELLVTPAPRPLHQLALHRLHLALGTYLERERVGRTSPGATTSWFSRTCSWWSWPKPGRWSGAA